MKYKLESKEKAMRDTANFFTLALVFVFLISTLTAASAKEIVVDSGTNGEFRSIQEAVSNSFPGDTIIVRPGTYKENVIVNTAGLTIRSGSKNDVIVEFLNESGSVFLVKADNVTISGFKIVGSREHVYSDCGICLEDIQNCTITENNFIGNRLGVSILNSRSNNISQNLFLNNLTSSNEGIINAISLGEYTDMNNLTDNIIENGYIALGPGSSGNLISGNSITNGGGIVFACCGRDNIISGNTIYNCSSGIDVYDQEVNINNNSIKDCFHGLDLSFADGTGIHNNTILNCSIGINLGEGCSGIKLFNNKILYSTVCGIYFPDNEGNEKIYNNYFNNTQNIRLGASKGNLWNNSLVAGINIVGGPYLGGNFWAQPNGTGFSQMSADKNRDGIADSRYNIGSSEFDYLPLVSFSNLQKPGFSDKNDILIVKAEPGLPKASFSTSVSEGYAPLWVKFTDSSEDTTGWYWEFGDGATATNQNPIYTYFKAGDYLVNLTAKNVNGTDSTSQTITVHETPVEEKVLPVADFSAVPESGNAPLTIQFTDHSQNAAERSWDFTNDGITDDNNEAPVVEYTVPGVYTVKLTVTNVNGTDFKTREVTVNEAPNEERILPIADFSAHPTRGNAPLSVQFIDHSQNAVTRSWDFTNDGVADDNSEAPIYEYTVPGVYTVNLTAINDNGTDSKILEIVVNEMHIDEKILPKADFSAVPASGNAPLSVKFNDLSKNATGWNWDFNDGTTSTDQNPAEHTYSIPGKYTVSLRVTNDNGTDSKNMEVNVLEVPIEKILPAANFTVYPTSGNAPLSVQFTDFSQNATSRSWDFNNDGIADSNNINPVYIYTVPGAYTVNLTASNENGTAYKTAIINVLDGSSSGGGSSGGSSGSSSSHSSSGGSGGGGAGGSPELQSNVEIKELSQAFVTSGSSIRFDFPKNATSVLYITFNSKKTAGKTTTIVEMLKGKSTLVSQLPSGEIYKLLNIWVGNSGFATPNNIENSVVCFKVEKSWMQDKSINQSSITLQRYSESKWNSLTTSLIGEDSKYLYLRAQTPGFSPFAITGGNTATKEIFNKTQPAADAKVQSGGKIENVGQSSTVSQTVQRSELTSEQKSTKGKGSNLPIFAMICMIALLLVAFLFKVDKKP